MTRNADQTEAVFLTGRPIVTVFHNPDNLFSILKLKIRETNSGYTEKEIIVKGHFPQLIMEEDYRFTGKLANHPTYGAQFDAASFSKELPATETGLVHYLSGDLFPGIGMKTAETIVKKLGTDAIRKIMNDPSVLDEIPRLSDERKETLRSVIEENMGMERIVIQLNEWGFGPQIGMRIYQAYREETIELLTENPYRLVEEIEGVGFLRADELGKSIGITGQNSARIKAAILYIMHQSIQSAGHVYVEAAALLPDVKRLLETSQREEIPFKQISNAIIELVEESKLSADGRKIYIPSLYFSEIGIASKINKINERTDLDVFPAAEIRKAIGGIEDRIGVNYAETQTAAIEKALTSPILVLTGGPGTGKTTVIQGLVEVYAELHGLPLDPKEYAKKKEPFPIVLAAPTGRAAKRMAESTGLPAMTIHRLLGFTGQEKEEETEKEVEAKLIIIDEMSMVDTWLAHQLMKALPNDSQLILVGDQDQLPPVGPGKVLKDLLASHRVPVVELTEIYRQSAGSSIIELAHMMKRGDSIADISIKTSDRSFIKADSERITEVVQQIISNALSKGHHIKDIQVLAPMYKGPAGIDALNKMIQQMVNPPGPDRKEIVFGETVYRIGDKVLQLVNQPESHVFNGDMGEVIAIIKAKETIDKKDLLVVSYDGIEVNYERSDLQQITLAYCCSIHKAQGSEFPTVIMPVVRSHRKMLRRNLLYTAITRAKNFLILCGDPHEFQEGIRRAEEMERQTTLQLRLEQEMDGTELVDDERDSSASVAPQLTNSNYMNIDPMIGMDGIAPLQFME